MLSLATNIAYFFFFCLLIVGLLLLIYYAIVRQLNFIRVSYATNKINSFTQSYRDTEVPSPHGTFHIGRYIS